MDMRHLLVRAVILPLFLMVGCAGKGTRGPEKDTAIADAMVAEATQVLERHLTDSGGDTLKQLIAQSKGMMIIPSAGEVGLMLSFSGGSGVLLANTESGWTGPVFMTRSSVGWGWQGGVSSQSGIVLFMHEDDVRYVMETGFVFKGQARLVFLSTDYECNETPEFHEAGDVYFVGNRTGLFAGVAFDTGGYSDRPSLNEAFTGVVGGDPETILYKKRAKPEGAARLRELINNAAKTGEMKKKKDETEVSSYSGHLG